ncbi:unnamed protein product, partial [Symbiodinium sp. KB8]
HYFAAVLPQDIHYRTLQEYFLPLTTLDEDPSDVYIGYRDEPWPPQTDVKLTDGDVITVLKQPGGSFHKYRVSTLFEPGAHWNHPKHLFHLNFCTSVCVLYRDKRYCVPEHHHYGRNLVEYVAERLRVNPYCTVMCTFPVSDLDVQGDLCPYVVTVAEVPHPENTGINRDRARDIFVLLDPRPLGHKPCFLFLHHPVVHLPSIEAMLGLSTGRSRRLGVMGGNRQGDDVFVEGCAALVLFAEITDEATSVSEAPSPRDDPLLESPSNQFEEARDADGPRPLGLPLHPVTSTALSSPIGEIWEGGAQLTMEGVELFDPTLPPGQSWNEAFLTNATQGMENPMGQDQAPRGTISTVARDALDAAVTRIQALIFVPDFVPEIVDVAIHLPAAIDSLRSKIQAARSPEQSFSFPMLYQVSPQPLREFAIFVAGPEWQSYTVIVLFDCRRYNHCVFAQAVPGHLSRESLLHAAGVPPDEAVHVYVHGLIQPLAIDQRITLLHGMTISITPRDEGGPACCDLADMLQTADGWDCNAPIPGPAVHFNSHFYLLTEGQPFAFQVKPQGQATFRDDVARAVGSPEHRLSICIVTPRIPDAYPFGYWTSAVLVVTEALSRIPCPPARLPEKRMVLVLDQRRILRGIVWRLVESRVIKVQDIADTYYDICPFRHVVSIEGARNEVRNGESVFILQPGQVLVVEFVPEKCSPTSTDHDTDQPGWPSQTEDHDVTHRYVTAASSLPGATVTETQPGVARSRSPRGRNLQNTACLTTKCPDSVRTSLEPPGPNHKMCKLDLAGKDQDLTSNKVGTEPIVLHDWAPTVQIPLLPIRSLPSGTIGAAARACKLLSEPAGTPWQDSAIDFARDAAQLLGDAWPFPPYRWPIETPEVDDGDSQTIELGEGFMTDIVLFLLTPDYTPERLDLTVQLPQSVEDIVDLAQTCRETARRQLFPVLVEVRQQPDPGWGLFLALPSWLQHRAVVCADLSFFDGRIFAISLHSQTDRYALCDAVGLAPTADVDIYVPEMAAPLPRGADCQLTTGMCIVFVQPGMARPGSFSLRTMLCSHLPWEHSPIFPRDSLENGYCAVGPGGQVLFRLHPERAFYYRADIALLTDLHPLRAVITPAAPQPSDVCVRGWICRAVVAATDRDDQVAWDGTVVPAVPGLLDCRPLMLGWLPVTAPTFWLDLEPIRHALNQSAPAGKVVVVAFEEADAQTVSARCDTAGDPWNDLADYIAKTAAGQQKIWPCPPAELCHAIAAQDISWLAPEMDARVHHAAPIHDGMVHWSDQCIPRAPLHPQQLVPTTQEGESGDSHPKGFSLLAATINIQSLRTKCKYVEDQLVARGIQIAFLQETKLPGGTVTSEHYLRLQTGAESHWGVGIWIHRKLGVLKLGTEALLVDESDVATLHETPRLLVVLLTVGDLRIGLLSGHCPHASRPQERLEFLNTLAPLLQRLKQTNLLIGGIDLNGRIPPNFTGVSGSLEFGEPDETGWSFAPICADAGIWIPSMYTQLHCGDSTTYVHPNGQQHRIDYVFLGGKATVEYAKSNVDGAFDNGSPQEDHMLLQLSIKGSLAASRRPSRLLRPTYDREKILSVEGRERVRCTLAAFQHPAWDVHPDQHCLQLEEFLRNALDDHFAKPPVQRRASYIPDTVWTSNAVHSISGEQNRATMLKCSLESSSKKHAPVTFAALFVLSHLRRSQRLGRSAAVLFLDTSAAYYRIVRELAIGDIRADATVITLFRRFGLDDEDINELMSTVKEGGMLAQAGAPDALRQVVKDIHLHTWFVSRFSDGTKVCSSLAGSRPGESWADLIYAFIYSRVLHKIQEFALAEGLSFTVSFDETEGPFPTTTGATDLVATDTTWADDSAFPLEDESPERLMQKTVRLCTLVISFCEGHGMAPNLKRGKTSVLISLSGKGCKRVRGRYFPAGAKSLHLPDLNVGVVVADQYKHLGGYLDCKLTMKPEARFRLAQAASSYTAAKALLLNSPRLDIKTRAALFASAVTPTFFNIGLWLPSGQAWEMLSNGYSKLVRRLLITNVGAHRAFHVPLPFAHWSTGCWRLDLVARRARLSLLVSLVQAGPPLLWAMLQNEMCWFKVLQVDLQWFVKTEEDSWPRPASCAWPEWHHLLKTAPQRFKRSLRRKLDRAHELQCRQDTALIGQWHCYRTLIDRLPPLTKTLAWTCRLCNKSLSTKAALGAHFFKVHGRVAEYRLVACGTRCDACNTNFWTEGRLAAHLRASPGCVSSLRQRGNQAEQVRPGFGSKKRRQDDSVAFTLSLPSRQGSIPSAPECPDWGKEQRCVYQELCARLFEVEADVTTAALLPSILCILRQKPLYPEEVLSILETIIEEVREITSDGLEDPWTSDTAQVLLQVLDSARSGLWAEPRDQIHPRLAHSLRDFRSFLDDFDWETSLQSLRSDNGTPSVLEFHVLQGWEADWQQNYSQAEVSAVVEDFGTILPEVLRRAWQSLLTGCTVAIHAPLDFWASQLAAPFRWARAPFCKPN